MIRLFVALRPPPLLRTALIGCMGGVHGARWQSEDQLHLTLRFIGDVDQRQAQDIAASLTAVRSRAIDLALGRPGLFERKGKLESLWIAANPAEALKALHDKIDRALVRAGLPPEGRAFVPHITIARFSAACGAPTAFLTNPPLMIAPQRVDHFSLFESMLGRGGSSYTVVDRYPLSLPPEDQ